MGAGEPGEPRTDFARFYFMREEGAAAFRRYHQV